MKKIKEVVFPDFIHDFGDEAHHLSLMRTAEMDDYGYKLGTGASNRRFVIHEALDPLFYRVSRFLIDWDGTWIYTPMKAILSFFWGLNCAFPFRDVVSYVVWYLKGCPAKIVYEG